MASIDLWFRATEVCELAEHALAAPDHRRSLTQIDNGEPATPALVWAKDDGTYLTSNGLPRQREDPHQSDGWARCAFAHGWGRGTGPLIGETPVGGDDFAEFIDLTEPLPDGGTLIADIRTCAAADGWMIITAMPGQFAIGFSTDTP